LDLWENLTTFGVSLADCHIGDGRHAPSGPGWRRGPLVGCRSPFLRSLTGPVGRLGHQE
jgi:hypothetical protein